MIYSIIGNGLGGFVGGQLVDNLGCSLPLLFKIASIFLFSCAIILYFVYNIWCKKYEQQLVKMKEEELSKRKINQKEGEETMPDLNVGESMAYLAGQVAGISRM